MRLLCVHPGADYATSDVYDGLVPALTARGVECVPYALSARIDRAASWLYHVWQTNGGQGAAPSDADVAYQAGIGALERALRLRVDWVLVFSAMYLHPDVIVLLRRAGVRIALVLTESPYEEEAERRLLPWAEVVWTNERTCVEPYRQVNPNVFYLPHAYDPVRHFPVRDEPTTDAGWTEGELNEWMADSDTPSHDVVFVGTPFPERVEALEAVDWTGIDLGLYGFWDEATSPESPLRKFVRAEVIPNRKAAQLYRRAKIGLNLFRTSRDFAGSRPRVEGAESMNPRVLELAACGTFQISDWRPEVQEVFGPVVPTFQSPDQLEGLLREWLTRPGMRQISANTARHCAASHTFDQRAEQVLAQLQLVSAMQAALA